MPGWRRGGFNVSFSAAYCKCAQTLVAIHLLVLRCGTALVTRKGLPDGDFKVHFEYPADLISRRRATGFGLYKLLGIDRNDLAARNAQMRKSFTFFGAPTAKFIFVHRDLHEYAVLAAGIFLQSLMLSAEAHRLATCAQGALATYAGPVRTVFDVPAPYKLICGLLISYAADDPVNQYNPGRGDVAALKTPL